MTGVQTCALPICPEKIAKDLLMREEEVEEILGKVVSEKVE